MPIKSCKGKDGRPGFQWGNHGKCYTYKPGDKRSKERAKARAGRQAAAAYAHGYKGEGRGG